MIFNSCQCLCQWGVAIALLFVFLVPRAQPWEVDAGESLAISCLSHVQLEAKLKNWEVQTSDVDHDLKAICFTTDSVGFVGGGYWNGNTILRTTDAGLTWNEVNCPTNNVIYDIHFLNPDVGIAVGGNSTYSHQLIVKTYNGGTDWDVIMELDGNGDLLQDIYFVNDQVGYVVGTGSAILKTEDGGESWVNLNNVPSGNYTGVHFLNGSVGFAVGASGVVIKTQNGGQSWQSIDLAVGYRLNCIYFHGEVGFILGDNGICFKSEDGGANWQLFELGTLASLYDMKINPDGNGLISGRRGTILVTRDSGENWNQEYADFGLDINAVEIVGDNIAHAAGDNGAILKQHPLPQNYSVQWAPTEFLSDPNILDPIVSHPTSSMSYTVTVSDADGLSVSDNVSVVVYPANVQISSDPNPNPDSDPFQLYAGVETGLWKVINNEISGSYYDVHFINADTGFATGIYQGTGILVKTTDGGKTWNHRYTDFNGIIYSIHFPTEDIGYAGCAFGKLLKTTDGGETWVETQTQTTEHIQSIHFSDSNHGIGGCNSGITIRTSNGGQNWYTSDLNSSSTVSTVYMLNSNRCYAKGVGIGTQAFFQSESGGAYWSAVTLPEGFFSLNHVDFLNEDVGYMLGSSNNFTLLRTINGGESWEGVESEEGSLPDFDSGSFTEQFKGYTVSGGTLYNTMNGGLNWTEQYEYSWGNGESMHFPDESNGYVVGSNVIVKYSKAAIEYDIQWTPSEYILDPDSWYPMANPTESAVFNLEVSYNGECMASGSHEVLVPVGIEEQVLSNRLRLTPVPSRHHIDFILNNTSLLNVELSIYDLTGRQMHGRNIQLGGDQIYRLNHSYRPGLYIAVLKTDKETHTAKFIVE